MREVAARLRDILAHDAVLAVADSVTGPACGACWSLMFTPSAPPPTPPTHTQTHTSSAFERTPIQDPRHPPIQDPRHPPIPPPCPLPLCRLAVPPQHPPKPSLPSTLSCPLRPSLFIQCLVPHPCPLPSTPSPVPPLVLPYCLPACLPLNRSHAPTRARRGNMPIVCHRQRRTSALGERIRAYTCTSRGVCTHTCTRAQRDWGVCGVVQGGGRGPPALSSSTSGACERRRVFITPPAWPAPRAAPPPPASAAAGRWAPARAPACACAW